MRLTFCAACGSKDDLQHHHLVTRSAGDSDDERNLITLCDPCHAKLRERRSDGPTAADSTQRGGRDRRGGCGQASGGFRREEEAVLERSGGRSRAAEGDRRGGQGEGLRDQP
jgi:hypothetical protein